MQSSSITYLFTSFATKHRDNLDKLMKEIGLHGGQIFVLNSLWNSDGLSQAELVKQLNLSAPTVYNMVGRLSETGFVTVSQDEDDARISRIFLTEKGTTIKNSVLEQWSKLEELTFANLTEIEKMMFAMLLEKILSKQN
jgi:MarR family transcriptional regulator, organic hydroperoxide resistance regulator